MTSFDLKRALAVMGRPALVLCSILVVKIARADSDDVERKGLGRRLVAVPRTVGRGVGALVSPVTTRVARVGAKVHEGIDAARAGARAIRDGGAWCANRLTSTATSAQEFLTHSPEPWDLGPDIEADLARVWANPPNLEAALRDHLRLIYEARVKYVGSKINFESVAEAEAFRQTIGRFWSPESEDYSDYLHDTIDPRFHPECVHAIETIWLARELGRDFYERFDFIRAHLPSVVSLDSIVPLPGHIVVRLMRLFTYPILDYRNENARIGALWEVARLLPRDVRERMLVALEHYVRDRNVPDVERARFRRFVHSGEFERVGRSIETLRAAKLIVDGPLGPEQLIVRSNDIDTADSREVREDLRRKIKPGHAVHERVVAAIGDDAVKALARVFTHDEYLELDNGSASEPDGADRDRLLAKILARYKWMRFTPEEREDIERAHMSLAHAHLTKREFIEKLSEVHDNEFRRVVLKSVLPEFMTKRAPREFRR